MGLVQGIQKIAQGDIAGGIMDTVGMGSIYDLARGNMSGGQFAKELGMEAGVTVATAGVGAAAGAAASGLSKIAQAGVQAGKAASIGTKLASGTSKVLNKVAGLISPNAKGQLAGGGAPVAGGYKGTLPKLGGNPVSQAVTGNKVAGATTDVKEVATGVTPSITKNSGKLGTLKAKASTIKTKAGKVAGQVGVQGALSVGSAIMGAKQANAANEVSKQSLLFQKQTYNEQQAEIEKNKAQRRADALTDYNAASLFGSQLYGSESNNTLLTNYHTNNGTGNQGSFSLLNASISTSKRTDLT